MEEESRVNSVRVLVVEDHKPSRIALVRLLRCMGFDVSACGNVAEGLQLISALPHILILDLMLPDGSGTQVLRRLREQNLPVTVAIVSGAGDELLTEAVTLKPDALFGKPLRIHDFQNWLDNEARRHASVPSG